MERQCLYVDNTIGALAEYIELMREERGGLLEAQASIATIVYDVLWWIGVPEGAIRLVLGEDANGIQQDNTDGVYCSCCDKTAVGLVNTVDGWRLVCHDHATEVGVV